MPNSRRDRVPPPEGYRLCNRAEKDCINGYVHEDDPFKTCEACRAKRRNQRERQKMTAVFNEQLVIHPELLEATEEDVITTTDRSTAALLEAGGQQYRPEPTPPPPAARPAKRKKVIKEGREVTRGITPYPSRAACVDALQEAYNQLELGSTEDFLFHGSFFDDACEFRNAEVAPDKRTADAYLHTIRADIARALEMVFTMHDAKGRPNNKAPFSIRYYCGQDVETAKKKPRESTKQRAAMARYECKGRLSIAYHPVSGRSNVRFTHSICHPRHPIYLSGGTGYKMRTGSRKDGESGSPGTSLQGGDEDDGEDEGMILTAVGGDTDVGASAVLDPLAASGYTHDDDEVLRHFIPAEFQSTYGLSIPVTGDD